MESKFPLVSVCLTTFNQEKYITKALESVLMQNVTFEMEIIIADDFSTDTTREILNQYQIQYSENLKLLLKGSNKGLAENWKNVIETAKGKYIAYLEGDDYWTDPEKLQKQVEYLESHPEAILCFHDFVYVNENGESIPDPTLDKSGGKKTRSSKEMITGCLIHQNTIMFRNLRKPIPDSFFKAKNHDSFYIAYLANWGNAGYIDCSPLHYRILNNSLWSSLSSKQKHWNGLITFFWILTVVPLKYYPAVLFKIGSKLKQLINFNSH